MELILSFAGEPLDSAKACQRPCFLNCKRIDGLISLSSTVDGSFDTVDIVLEGEFTGRAALTQIKFLTCSSKGLATTWVKDMNAETRSSPMLIACQRASCLANVTSEKVQLTEFLLSGLTHDRREALAELRS